MKKLNRKKFNIFIAILIPLLIILTITTTFLIQNLIAYINYKSNTINTNSISSPIWLISYLETLATAVAPPKVK